MAKNRNKRKNHKRKSSSEHQESVAKKGISRTKFGLFTALAALIGWGVWGFVGFSRSEAAFNDLVRQSPDLSARIKTYPNEGRGHVPEGNKLSFGTDPPTSGAHFVKWIDPGVYDEFLPSGLLVHSLEHGMIVIYLDKPDPEARKTLEEWAGLFKGPFSGIVVTRGAGLGKMVQLTAWRRVLSLKKWDSMAAAAFIDRFRGRGPENPVR